MQKEPCVLPCPDSERDCTAAMQAALDRAGETGGTVLLAPGIYRCGTLRIPAHITFAGASGWSLARDCGSVISLCNPDAACLLDCSQARGTSLVGLCLCGGSMGDSVHGIAVVHGKPSETADGLTLDGVKCSGFSGDGIHFENASECAVRHSMLARNAGNGAFFSGSHLLLTDTQIFENGLDGLFSDGLSASSVSSCRFSGNAHDGARITGGRALQILDSSFDTNASTGLRLCGSVERLLQAVTVTADMFHSNADAHLDASLCASLTVGGCLCGRGTRRPTHAMIFDRLWHASVTGCAMAASSDMEAIDNHANHRGDIIFQANIG